MLRASKAILCALAADVATLISAARTQVNAEGGSGAARVIGKIGALLQARGGVEDEVLNKLHSRALQLPPGIRETLNEELTKIIDELETEGLTHIKSWHPDTQRAVDAAVDALRGTTTNAVDEKQNADGLDGLWYSCVQDEKAKRVAIEEAEEALKQAQKSQILPCQQQEERKATGARPQADSLKFSCDISTHGNCDAQFENYKAQIESMTSGVKDETKLAVESWTEAKTACDAAEADVLTKTSALGDATSAWHAARRSCKLKHEPRQLALCMFGEALQRKCGKATGYRDLIEEVEKENGNEHSRPDHVKEWKSVSSIKCMLSKFVATGDMSNATLDECEKAVNFDRDVGVLDEKQGEFAELTSPAKFTCDEATITFSGAMWEVPTGEAPASSEYVSMPFAPEVNLDEDSFPFALCSVNARLPEEAGRGSSTAAAVASA